MYPGRQGFYAEDAIVKAVDGRIITDLNDFMASVIRWFYPDITTGDRIVSFLCNRSAKPDVFFSVKDIRHYLSVKSGNSDEVHLEHIVPLIKFLRSLGVSVETQKTILLYHWGDGTLDGHGTQRHEYSELITMYKDRIALANKELQKPEIIMAALQRFVFQGADKDHAWAEALLHGTVDGGVFVPRQAVENWILWHREIVLNPIHIGPFVFKAGIRDIHYRSHNTQRRQYVNIKWPGMKKDLTYIQEHLRFLHAPRSVREQTISKYA